MGSERAIGLLGSVLGGVTSGKGYYDLSTAHVCGDLLGVLVIYTDEVGLGFLIQELDVRAYYCFFFFFLPPSPFARYQHLMEAHSILLILILSVKRLLK